MNKTKSTQLLTTISDLESALNQWDSIAVTAQPEASEQKQTDIRKKTQELLKKLNEQIKELGL